MSRLIRIITIQARIQALSLTFMLLPGLIALEYGEKLAWVFLTMGSLAVLALFPLHLFKPSGIDISVRESIFIVILTWVFFSILGAIPFVIDGSIQGWLNATFEVISGFTATGSTVLTNIEALPKSLIFWRSETQFLGGIGIILIVIAFFPRLPGTKMLFNQEAPIDPLQEKISARFATVARQYLMIYTGFMLTQIVMLTPAIGLLDAVNISFTSIAGGGFAPRNASIAAYNSLYVEMVSCLFMLLGATSFILHFRALIGGKPRVYFESSAFKAYLLVLGFSTVMITLAIWQRDNLDLSFTHSLRAAFFQVVSIGTTTGFATENFKYWPPTAIFLLILLMFIGGMAASTSGSIKVNRHVVLLKELKNGLLKVIHPSGFFTSRLNKRPLERPQIESVLRFTFWYLFIFMISTLIVSTTRMGLVDSMSAVATTLANTGPGVGRVGPFDNFSWLPGYAKLTLMTDMIMGRLELYPILLLFLPDFWKK